MLKIILATIFLVEVGDKNREQGSGRAQVEKRDEKELAQKRHKGQKMAKSKK